MTRPHVAYAVHWSSAGCMPDSTSGPYYCATRRDLVALIRDQLEAYDLPASRLRDVGVRRLWARITRAGSASCAGFSIPGPVLYSLEFSGLTQAEADEMEAADD